MSIAQTSAPAGLEAVRQQYRALGDNASLRARAEKALHGFDRFVANHPKLSLAAAAAVGGLIATGTNPLKWLHDRISTTVSALEGAAVSAIGLHVVLHQIPSAISTLASNAALSPAHTHELLIAGVVSLGAAIGHALARHRIEKRDQVALPPSPGQASSGPVVQDKLQTAARRYSGLVLGGAVAAGAAALLGATALLPLVAAGALGTLGGSLLGPVMTEDGVSPKWKLAGSLSLIPAGALLGLEKIGWPAGPCMGAMLGALGTFMTSMIPALYKQLPPR